jgi:DNA-binding transcriptional MerR regulator
MSSAASGVAATPAEATGTELTIDRLAVAAGMTVRNVRAYAGRGLLPPPRLKGRTGYYSSQHLDRLLLVRDLLDRGFTLSAVEDSLRHSSVSASHALELLGVLDEPRAPEQPVRMSVHELARMAGVDHDSEFVDQLVAVGLVEREAGEGLLLVQPAIVRAGAQAVAMGLSRASVLELLPFIASRMREVSQRFVAEVREQVWQPFTEAGFPEEQWPEMLQLIETLLPVAGQAVVSIFRRELNSAIDDVLGEELERFGAPAPSTGELKDRGEV